jgi:abortive infection bacteriophage resistance protein
MKFTKPATDIAAQIEQLKSRGLIIGDETKAKRILSNVSYYRLAGYWWPLQSDKTLHMFKPYSTLETVMKIYHFDAELRKLIFDMTEEIEIAFRSKMIYHLAHELSPWWFEDPSNFQDQGEHSESMKRIKKDLSQNKKKEVFLSEHYKKYNSDERCPPAWKTLEILSFGTLSKLYGNLIHKIKAKDVIAFEFGTVNHTYFHSWAQDISQIRNICAHHGRVWNKNLPGRPKLLAKPPFPWIKDVPPVMQHEKLYIHLCCMKYLINIINPRNNFSYRIYVLLKKYPNIDWNALGFPRTWQKEPLWNNKMAIRNPIITFYHKVTFIIRNL